MAESAARMGFQLSAPAAVEQRPDGLTLRGREGAIHIATAALPPPPGWPEAAAAGVQVLQNPDGSWELRTDGPADGFRRAGGGFTALAWEVPAANLGWHRPLPGLLEPLGQPFRGPSAQRVLGRALVRLLGVPGIVPLLIRWHRRRTRQRA